MSIKQIGSNVFRYWAILNVLQVTRMRKFSKIDKQIPYLTEKKKKLHYRLYFPLSSLREVNFLRTIIGNYKSLIGGKMSSAYVIASVHVTNAIEFEKYRLQVPSVTEGFGGKYLARGGKQKTLEGEPFIGNRTVIVEFESYERALEWYHSNEYSQLVKLRQAGSYGTLVVVEGV